MAKQPRSLYGQVAAITGGGRGIGRATAAALAREGAKVAIGDLDLDVAKKTAEELGSNVSAYEVDVTDKDSFEAFLDAAESDLGALDVLVNNAGIMQLGRFIDEDDATAIRQVDINIHGVIYGTKSALRRMRPRNRGHIVNIASSAGKAGVPGGATYCATKHAVVGLTEAIRGELAVENIEIDLSVVMPVLVNTELISGLKTTRGIKTQQPEDVAAAIVDALKFQHFDVFVPKSVGTINKVMTVLPRPAREAVGHALKADRVLLEIDQGERNQYELRASHSEPKLEEGEQPAELPSGG
jgi:NAD(P)-dependent dehydrogenase (short-subunit alcohol dehydrogenase family)